MQIETYQMLQKNPTYVNFVRQNPLWYRYLTRDPRLISEVEKEAKEYYGKTLPQQIEKFGSQVQMLHMFVQLAGNIKD